jgi:hypothetical protein
METQLATSKEEIGDSIPVIESEIGQTDTKLEGKEDPLNWSPLPRCKTEVHCHGT